MDHRYAKFLVLAEAGSFSAAAKQLKISQPAMTLAIASLEKSIGAKLIARKKPTVQLTSQGNIVYQTAIAIGREIDNMMNEISQNSENQSISVGFIDSIAHLAYNSPIRLPLLNNLQVVVDNSLRIINDVMSRQVEFGFITGQDSPLSTTIAMHKIQDEEFVFVASPTYITTNPIDDRIEWLAYNQASTTYRHFIRKFKKLGIRVRPTFFSTSMDLLRDMALNGAGVALLPRHFVVLQLTQGSLVELPIPSINRPIWLIYRKHEIPANLNILQDYVNNLLSKTV